MTNEKRKHPRKGFDASADEFSFYLEDKSQLYEIRNVQDVSISGVGIHFPGKIDRGQKITLKYESPDYHLSIDGTIAWCDNSTTIGSCRLGVEFDLGSQEDNALFFLAVRRFLDHSDGLALNSR
jgi:PilZ domain